MREISRDKLFDMTTQELEDYRTAMFVGEAMKLAKRTATKIANTYFATHSSDSEPMTERIATQLAKTHGVKKELCGFSGRIAMRLINERHVR